MKNESIEISDDIKVEIPQELFEEARIPIDCVLEMYCVDGKIIIAQQIDDDFICDENCENCPCFKKCEWNYDRKVEIHDFISNLSSEEQELVQKQLDLTYVTSATDEDNILAILSLDDIKCFTIQLFLKWVGKTNGEQND